VTEERCPDCGHAFHDESYCNLCGCVEIHPIVPHELPRRPIEQFAQ
jgi:hypothetical protein